MHTFCQDVTNCRKVMAVNSWLRGLRISASVVGPYLILLVQCWLCAGWCPNSLELENDSPWNS